MRRLLLIISAFCLFGVVGCNSQHLVDKALNRVDQSVADARKEAKDTIKDARSEFDAALEKSAKAADDLRINVSADVARVQADFDRKITDLDRRFQERIDQIRSAATDLVKQSDAAIQARIDQVFAELRLFVKETLAQIQELVRPILAMTEKVGSAFDVTAKAIATVSDASNRVATKLESVLTEVQVSMTAFRTGKNPDGSSTSLSGILGILAGIGAAAKGIFDNKKRKDENAVEGYRWHPDELKAECRNAINAAIAEGVLAPGPRFGQTPPPPVAPQIGATNAPAPTSPSS